ncbi:MAG: hypothetical protein JRH11_18400, partial [Deltaproteobacteria bacterium]|nr:hypothetical protein [Deltaproteobacteria bacterium]
QGGGGGGGSAEISSQCRGGFGASAPAHKLSAFINASADFAAGADDIARTLESACSDMGRELGIPDAQMAANGNTPAVKAACDAVAAKIQSEMTDLRGSAELRVVVVSEPPRCEVSVDAYASCAAECDVDYDPGQVEMQCEGGEIRGTCSAECTGSCSVEAHAECSGTCEGTCQGSCQGSCNGTCEGECSATNAEGQCTGTCSAGCQGSCEGGCDGTCEGSCVAEASGQCSGECRGGCSVEFQEPRCTGTVRAPSVSADCEASCDAQLDARAECTPGHTEVTIEGNVGADAEERIGRLRQALRNGIPRIMSVGAKLQRLRRSGQILVNSARHVPQAAHDLGLTAVSCATQSAAVLGEAFGSVSVSVDVSVSVSASASAGTS